MGYLTAANGWKALIAGVLAYEVACAEGELLSEGFDRLVERHPLWPRVVVVAVALHVANLIPPRLDVVHLVFQSTRDRARHERLMAWGKRALSRRLVARKSSA